MSRIKCALLCLILTGKNRKKRNFGLEKAGTGRNATIATLLSFPVKEQWNNDLTVGVLGQVTNIRLYILCRYEQSVHY